MSVSVSVSVYLYPCLCLCLCVRASVRYYSHDCVTTLLHFFLTVRFLVCFGSHTAPHRTVPLQKLAETERLLAQHLASASRLAGVEGDGEDSPDKAPPTKIKKKKKKRAHRSNASSSALEDDSSDDESDQSSLLGASPDDKKRRGMFTKRSPKTSASGAASPSASVYSVDSRASGSRPSSGGSSMASPHGRDSTYLDVVPEGVPVTERSKLVLTEGERRELGDQGGGGICASCNIL
jgi:hypothetical protein